LTHHARPSAPTWICSAISHSAWKSITACRACAPQPALRLTLRRGATRWAPRRRASSPGARRVGPRDGRGGGGGAGARLHAVEAPVVDDHDATH